MIGLLGKKVGMSQIFDEVGKQIPVTVLELGPCFVTGLRTKEKHGYSAVQIGYDVCKANRFNKAKLGFFKKAKVPTLKYVREIRTDKVKDLEVGSELGVDTFAAGDFVDVVGTSIGKGFQGVVKRYGYKGGGAGHGSMFGRVPGGIGSVAGGKGARKKVRKGKGLPGHMGNERICIHNLKVMKVDAESNLLVLAGSVPGYEGNYLMVRAALKRGKKDAWKVRNAKEEPAKATSEAPKSEEPQEGTKESS